MKTGSFKPIALLIAAASIAILASSALAAPSNGGSSGPSPGGGSWVSSGSTFAKPSEYRSALRLIKNKKYAQAIPLLLKANEKSPNDPDILNELGFSYRESGQVDLALQFYNQALQINPDHKATREYLGELYLRQHQLPMAQLELNELKRICPNGCDERKELEKAVADYQAAHPSAGSATSPTP